MDNAEAVLDRGGIKCNKLDFDEKVASVLDSGCESPPEVWGAIMKDIEAVDVDGLFGKLKSSQKENYYGVWSRYYASHL